MITTARPGADEYAASFAGYVARIAEDEDIVADHVRHHLEVLEARYTA
jgi:hypothetical protein